MDCESCSKIIDDNSAFCKYCGKKVASGIKAVIDAAKLIDIFQRICDTLYVNSDYSKQEFDKEFNRYQKYENTEKSNNDYYKILVDIIFYSGFKASTVERYLPVIHLYFDDYKKIAKYDKYQIDIIKNDTNMLRNKSKIDACVENAIKLEKIVEKYGSFERYINSFTPNQSDKCLSDLKKSLERNFKFIGGTTAYHFMTDIGLNVLKPDRVNLRIFYRLGLIENDNDLFGAVKIGRSFSKALNLPIRYIDIIFVMYGQLDQTKIECICSLKNPKCFKCGVNIYCNYYKTTAQKNKPI